MLESRAPKLLAAVARRGRTLLGLLDLNLWVQCEVQGSGAANLDIIDFAKDLLLQLHTTFWRNSTTAGPITFIAHSMGGLVVRRADMLGMHDRQFSALIGKVIGIIFLATPHRGA